MKRGSMALILAVCALTTWVYPLHEKELVALDPTATIPLAARNAAFIALAGLLSLHAWRSGREKTAGRPEGGLGGSMAAERVA